MVGYISYIFGNKYEGGVFKHKIIFMEKNSSYLSLQDDKYFVVFSISIKLSLRYERQVYILFFQEKQ